MIAQPSAQRNEFHGAAMLCRLPIGAGAAPDSQYAGSDALWNAIAASYTHASSSDAGSPARC